MTTMSFPYIRPRRSPSYKKKGPNRPPPLKLHTTFLHAQDKQRMKLRQSVGSHDGAKALAVRGSISGPSETKEKDVEVPLKIDIGMSESEPSAEGEPLVNPMKMEKLAGKNSTVKGAGSRGTLSGGSLRTIVNLDKDSDSSDISPISDDRPPVRSSSALRRFFPELSTNIDLVSPTSTDKMVEQMEENTSLESELKRRVQSLCGSPSGDNGGDYSYESKTSSSSGSDGIFDGASSCYSRRSSLSSVNTDDFSEKWDHHRCADAYSIISPVAAGVFDDAASICPSRAPSVKSSLSVPSLRSRSIKASPKASPYPTRSNSAVSLNTTNTSNTMHDPKNKPLPLEPVSEADIAPSPLAVRRHNSRKDMQQRSNSIYTRSAYAQSSPSSSHLAVQSPYTTMRSPSGSSSPGCHACQSCGGYSPRPRKGRRSQWAEHLEKGEPHIRQLPSLSQAAEELEDVLADLQRQGSKQRTLLILDGPLQVSRHNGDLVATRPAPLPPSTKPHSMMHPSKESLQASTSTKSTKPGKEKNKPTRSAKVRRESRPIHLAAIPESDSQSQLNKDKSHQKSRSVDEQMVVKALEKGKEAENRPSTSYKDEEVKKDKSLKKSFTFSMKSFKRNKPVSVRSASTPLVPSSLSPSSDASLDPPDQPLQRKSSSDTSLAVEDSAQPKRDSLLLQLPRLQTNNLELTSLYDRVNAAVKGVTRSTAGSPQSSPTHPASSKGEEEEEVQVQTGKDEDLTPPEEKIVIEPAMKVPDRTRHMHAFVSTAQASSVQLPANQVYELDAAPPSPTSTLPAFDVRKPIEANITLPSDFPVRLTINIMEQIDSLDDLFNLVLVNKRFYCIFKKHELHMIKSALFKMSPPAWELREMSPPWATETQLLEPDSRVPEYTPSLYLDRYAQDIYTLARLKSMILVRCSPFLRRDTVRGLSGQDIKRAEEVDDAFWRIWTFCRIFGSNKGRENDIEGQVDWLRGGVRARGQTGASGSMTEPFGMSNVLFEPPEGFGRGNGAGLSPKQLYDMTEIWTCMGVLLQPLHGKCIEARRVGIYDGMDVPANDPGREELILEEWTSFVLTIGLSAVLGLSSIAPAEATAAFFYNAKSSGLTKWSLTETETSRSSFLKEAVSRVYEDHERTITDENGSPIQLNLDSQNQGEREQRHAAYKQELRARRARGRELGTGFAVERPMSEFSTIVHNLDGADSNAPPVPALPSLMLDRASTSTTGSAPPPRTPSHTPPPFQIQTSDLDPPYPPPPRSPPMQQSTLFPPPTPAPPPARAPVMYQPLMLPPQVQDPVDRAIGHMVDDLGFDREDVKWALKLTDTGEGIDVAAAEKLLNQQKQKKKKTFGSRKESLLHSVMKRQQSTDSGWRFA